MFRICLLTLVAFASVAVALSPASPDDDTNSLPPSSVATVIGSPDAAFANDPPPPPLAPLPDELQEIVAKGIPLNPHETAFLDRTHAIESC